MDSMRICSTHHSHERDRDIRKYAFRTSEISESMKPYNIAKHRHTPEIEQIITSTEESTMLEAPENSPQMKNDAVKSDSKPTGDVDDVILDVIRSSSNPDGMPYDSIVLACVEAGFSRESSEDAIEDLRDIKCEIIEPRFGFFQILD